MDQQEIFPPPKHFSEKAHIGSMEQCEALYKACAADPEKFWAEQARNLHWFSPWKQVLDWSNPPFARWFIGGKTNIAYNCIDRHLSSARRNKAAIIWEGENFEQRILTYQELYRRVAKFCNALKKPPVLQAERKEFVNFGFNLLCLNVGVCAALAALAVAGNVAGQVGDLCESALKRGAGVKDSGTSLPGHGGWLDRIDSSLFSIPVVYALLIISAGWV